MAQRLLSQQVKTLTCLQGRLSWTHQTLFYYTLCCMQWFAHGSTPQDGCWYLCKLFLSWQNKKNELKVNLLSLTHIVLSYLKKLLIEWNWYTTLVCYYRLKSARITLSIILAPVFQLTNDRLNNSLLYMKLQLSKIIGYVYKETLKSTAWNRWLYYYICWLQQRYFWQLPILCNQPCQFSYIIQLIAD